MIKMKSNYCPWGLGRNWFFIGSESFVMGIGEMMKSKKFIRCRSGNTKFKIPPLIIKERR